MTHMAHAAALKSATANLNLNDEYWRMATGGGRCVRLRQGYGATDWPALQAARSTMKSSQVQRDSMMFNDFAGKIKFFATEARSRKGGTNQSKIGDLKFQKRPKKMKKLIQIKPNKTSDEFIPELQFTNAWRVRHSNGLVRATVLRVADPRSGKLAERVLGAPVGLAGPGRPRSGPMADGDFGVDYLPAMTGLFGDIRVNPT